MKKRSTNQVQAKPTKQVKAEVREAKQANEVGQAKPDLANIDLDEYLLRANSKLRAMGSNLQLKYNIGETCTIAGQQVTHETWEPVYGTPITKVTLLREGVQVCILLPWKHLYISIMMPGGITGLLEDGIIKPKVAMVNTVCPDVKAYQTGAPNGQLWTVSRSDQADDKGYWTFTLTLFGREIQLQLPGYITQRDWAYTKGLQAKGE